MATALESPAAAPVPAAPLPAAAAEAPPLPAAAAEAPLLPAAAPALLIAAAMPPAAAGPPAVAARAPAVAVALGMPELVEADPALAACIDFAIMPLPAAAAAMDIGPPDAAGCIVALPGVVIITADASEGAAASLQARRVLSSKTGDKREGVSWIIGLLGGSRTVPRPI